MKQHNAERIGSAVYMVALVIVLFITLPLTITYFQPLEFSFSAVDHLLIGIIFVLPLGIVLGGLAWVLPPSIRHLVDSAVKVAIVYLSVFALLLPVPSGEQLGGNAVFDSGLGSELLFHAIFLMLLVFFVVYSKDILPTAAFALAAVCVGFAGYIAFAGPDSKIIERLRMQETLNDFATLSGESNILVVLLDELRAQLFYDTLLTEHSLTNHFNGFTFFTGATSGSPRTAMSLPNILSSRFYPGGSAQAWMDKATAEDGFLADAESNGFDPRYLQTMGATCGQIPCIKATSFADIQPWAQLAQEYAQLVRLGLMRVLPRAIHPSLEPGTFNRWASALLPLRSSDGASMLSEPEQHLDSLKRFTGALKVDADVPKRLTFVHVTFTHLPVDFDRDCNFNPNLGVKLADVMEEVYCGVSQLAAITDRLKELGIYDETAILFISDHGENSLYYHSDLPPSVMAYVPGEEEHYHPTIMFKPRGATEPLKFSAAPAALQDIRKTICGLMRGCTADPGGEDLSTLAEGSGRTRRIMHFRYGRGLKDDAGQYPADLYRFVDFQGPFSNLRRAIYQPHKYVPGEKISFQKGGNSVGYTFTGWSIPQENGTWSDARSGESAKIAFDVADILAPLTIVARVEAYVGIQKVDVVANGRVVATWEINAGGVIEEMTAVIPAEVVGRTKPLNLEFRPYKPVSPASLSKNSSDQRLLGLFVEEMRLDYR